LDHFDCITAVGSARLLINHRVRPDVIYGRHRRHVISLTMDRQQSDSDTETSAKLCAESWNPIHLRFTDSRGISLAATRDHLHSPGSRQRSKPLTGFLCTAGQSNPATQCRKGCRQLEPGIARSYAWSGTSRTTPCKYDKKRICISCRCGDHFAM